jgi:predicted AlkP superfamily pyrophosphatase or phosphodiesterase
MQSLIAGHHRMNTSIASFSKRAPRRNALRAFVVFFQILTLVAVVPASLAQNSKRAAIIAKRPQLVLLIAIDQFRADYLERFDDLFGAEGFHRLERMGARWTNANYDHFQTETAPGHATMMTGAYPAQTGIIGNIWYERAQRRTVTSVSDADALLLNGKTASPKDAASPRRLLASTLGDEIRLASNDRAKVIGISMKDRAAILPAGRHATAAYWMNLQTGEMVTSSYYFPQNTIPQWVRDFNEAKFVNSFYGTAWNRLLPEDEYRKRAGEDAPAWERVNVGTNTFPHQLSGGSASAPNADYYNALYASPFGNDVLVRFAEAAIKNERLGQRGETDVLTISFSSNDSIGHRYGPYSQEVMDATLRTDRQIAELLDIVDRYVGLPNALIALTADHGVAPLPEHAAALNLIAPQTGRIRITDIAQAINQSIAERIARERNAAQQNRDASKTNQTTDNAAAAQSNSAVQSGSHRFIENIAESNISLNYDALRNENINIEEAERAACEGALKVAGIAYCFTRAQLARGEIAAAADPLLRRVMHGFYEPRSPDIILVQQPYKYIVGADSQTGASHGTPYSYDTHVPLIIMGAGLRPGIYEEAASPCDIAPTLAALLRVQPPSNSVGRVLIEAFGEKR